MKVFWFTGRSLNDLCSTTQTSLASGLMKRGIDLTMVNSDKDGSHGGWSWKHASVPIQARPGFRSRALGKKMLEWCKKNELTGDSVCLLDWRIANYLIKYLEQRNISWILIDRSPPADSGLLSLLQWPSWRKSWRNVRKTDGRGCVVSLGHRQFVEDRMGINTNSISILPAGVDLELFHTSGKNQALTLVYHGKVDCNRGILALPMFLQKLNNSGVKARLIVIGNGDCFEQINSISTGNGNIEVHASMPQSDLSKILSKCHIGLLPMPDKRVWRLASPLKRSEYAASGLLIYGIDHNGHTFEKQDSLEWMRLVKQHDFHDEGKKWIQTLDSEYLLKLGLEARLFAEENLSWENSVDVLEEVIYSCSNRDIE
jgi:glycosyltransferase involved in cell wall biosynthesis|tara:strand:- start:672 stop:1784 length:1113 start_codon:yes stop_codon:yes gene_type:complete